MAEAVNMTLLYAALATDHGVVVETDDLEKCRQRLYAIRKEAMDPALDCLELIQSPINPLQLWIVKRKETPNAP